MSNTLQKQNLYVYKWSKFFIPSLLLSIALFVGIICMVLFLPDFLFHQNPFSNGKNYFDYINHMTIYSSTQYMRVFGWINWSVLGITTIAGVGFIWFPLIGLFCYLDEKNFHKKYIDIHTKIINSCSNIKFDAKVALVTPTCNDFSPNTLLQTAKQTYKNLDVWICNDSSKPEVIKELEEFAKIHGFHLLNRSAEHKKAHPSKVGNLMYFVETMGKNYDFILENDSSSLITSTFVENALCYFYSPLLDTSKTGGVCCFGSFYGTKAIIPYVNGIAAAYHESFGPGTGLALRFNGNQILLNGWGTLYRVDALKNIDLKRVECPSDDLARGLYMCLNGYQNYVEPFDFSSKFGPQNMQAFKVQRLKWNGGDVFISRSKLAFRKFPNKFITLFSWISFISIIVFIPFSFFLGLINVIIACVLNLFYFNLSAVIIAVCYGLLFAIVFIIVALIKKASLKPLLMVIIAAFYEAGIIYKRVWQIVYKGFIKHSWSSSAVTVKTVQRSTTKQKLRMSLWDFSIFILAITLCLILTFVPRMCFGYKFNYFIIWFNLFFFLAGPSMCYLLWIWIGEIKISTGWDNSSSNYPFWKQDFRFKYVKKSSIWSKLHPDGEMK